MKYIKTFKYFKESLVYSPYISNILESMNVIYDDLLSSIKSEKKDIIEEFKLDSSIFSDKLDLEFLSDSVDFINSLLSLGLKKSEIKYSNDFSTFLIKPCRFMFIYGVELNELENPEYILIQIWIENLNIWTDVECYKINDNIQKFYDKLSSKTLEIIEGNENWIYYTSNGNEWVLQNLESENDIYLKVFRKEDFIKILDERKPEVRIM
jgi:hypothetical protein